MSQIYRVLKDFELNNKQVKSGEEVVCRAREAEKLMTDGFLVESDRVLDPNDKKDAALMATSDKRAKDRHDEIIGTENDRGQNKEERQEASDEKRAKKVQRAIKLQEKLTGEVLEASDFESLSDEALDKEIERVISALPADEVEVGKYKITGKAEYTDEFGEVQGELEIGSIQELPVVVGEKFIADGAAEAYVEKTPKPRRTRD